MLSGAGRVSAGSYVFQLHCTGNAIDAREEETPDMRNRLAPSSGKRHVRHRCDVTRHVPHILDGIPRGEVVSAVGRAESDIEFVGRVRRLCGESQVDRRQDAACIPVLGDANRPRRSRARRQRHGNSCTKRNYAIRKLGGFAPPREFREIIDGHDDASFVC